MRKKKNNDFVWVELYKHNIFSYNDRFNNKCYDILKENNIEFLNQLDFYSVYNVDNSINCKVFVQKEDYEKGIEVLRKNGI